MSQKRQNEGSGLSNWLRTFDSKFSPTGVLGRGGARFLIFTITEHNRWIPELKTPTKNPAWPPCRVPFLYYYSLLGLHGGAYIFVLMKRVDSEVTKWALDLLLRAHQKLLNQTPHVPHFKCDQSDMNHLRVEKDKKKKTKKWLWLFIKWEIIMCFTHDKSITYYHSWYKKTWLSFHGVGFDLIIWIYGMYQHFSCFHDQNKKFRLKNTKHGRPAEEKCRWNSKVRLVS